MKKYNQQEEIYYYENEAKELPLFGSLREISLAENIMNMLPSSFDSIIDVGCGDGYLLYRIQKKFSPSTLIGTDLSEVRVKQTRKNVPQSSVLRGNCLSLPFPDNSFDIVVCSELLEHIVHPEKVVDELVRISKKHVIITVPNELQLTVVNCPKCKTKHYLDNHVNFFSKEKLRSLVKMNKEVKIKNMKRFHTIFTYNKLTMKFPRSLRLFFDGITEYLYKKISFLKPNFLMTVIIKKK